jgi:hypothetical protein
MPVAPNTLVAPLVASFLVWRVYRRFRRSIGRQPVQPRRMVAGIIVFSLLLLGASVPALLNTKLLIGLGCGVLLGVPLALVGLLLTRFETTPEGHFYTPNTYIGVGLSVLFVGRLAYRIMVLYGHAQAFTNIQQPSIMQSSLTLFMFALLASYYIAYYAGVLLRYYK